MTRNRRIGLALVTLALTLAAGCAKPTEDYSLVSRQAAEVDGRRFSFNLDLSDADCTYSTSVAARLNTARLSQPALELQMSVTSPGGQTAIERINLPLRDGNSRRHDGSVRDFLWPWREQIRVSGPDLGQWTVVITLPDPAAWKAVEGIGLSYQGKKWEKAN